MMQMISPGRANEWSPWTIVNGSAPLWLEHIVPQISVNKHVVPNFSVNKNIVPNISVNKHVVPNFSVN